VAIRVKSLLHHDLAASVEVQSLHSGLSVELATVQVEPGISLIREIRALGLWPLATIGTQEIRNRS